MAKTLCGGFQIAVASGSTGYIGIGLSNHSATTIESLHDQTIRTAGTFSNLSCTVLLQGTGASTLRFRENLANANQSISIPGSTTGFFEDISNTDNVVAGDEYDFQIISGTGGVTTVVPFVVFEATGNTTAIYGGTRALSFSTDSATRFISLVSRPAGYAETVEADAQIKIKEAGTWKNMDIKLSANSRITTTTWTSRINGVDGNMLVSVPASTSGHFEDTVNTDIVIVNDLLAIKMVTGTGGGNFDPETQKTEIEYSGDIFNMPSGLANDGIRAVPFNTTEYHLPIGLNPSSTESLRQIQMPIPLRFTNLQVHVITNTITGSASTVKVRKNSADGNGLVSISAGATGFFEDTVNSDSIKVGDKMAYEIITPNTSGTLSINMISTTGEEFILSQIDKTFTVDAQLEATCDADLCEDFSEYAFQKLPTFRDNFNYSTQSSADANWVPQDSAQNRVNPTTEVIDFDVVRDGTVDNILFDLGAEHISNTNWVLRWKMDWSTITIPASSEVNFNFGLYATTEDSNTFQDSITFTLQNLASGSLSNIISTWSNNQITQANPITFSTFDTSAPFYFEIKRTSATTVQWNVYSDVNYTVLIASQTDTIDSGVENLRYLGLKNEQGVVAVGNHVGTIDDIEFWNAGQQGDVTFEDDLKLKTISFEDDFTTDNFTNISGTKVSVNTGTEVIDWSATGGVLFNEGEFDDAFGAPINTSNWVLRCKLTVNTLVDGTDPTANDLFIGFSDDNTSLPQTGQDFIGWRTSQASTGNSLIRALVSDGSALNSLGGGEFVATPQSLGTGTFYLEFKRSGSIAIANIYSDAGFTTLIERQTNTIGVGVTGLRYLKIMVSNFDGTADSTYDGTLDDIEFYNGDSTLTRWLGAIGNDVRLDVINKRINFDPPTGVDRDELIAFDLQTILDGSNASDENWTLRFKMNTDTLVQGTSEESASLLIGLDSNLDPQASATHNLILFRTTMDQGGAGPQFGAISSSLSRLGGAYFSGTGTATQFPIAWSTGTRFVEVKRLSPTEMKVTLYTDASFTDIEKNSSGVPLSVQDTIDSGIINLRYIRVTTDCSAVANDTSYDGSIDDIEFYNGVSVSKTPVHETKDFEDPFLADNWADQGTGVEVNTGTQVIDWTSILDTVARATVFDLGVGNVSDTEWTLRFKYRTDTLTAGSTRTKYFWIGLFDSDQTVDSESVQDAIVFEFFVNSTLSVGRFSLSEKNGVILTGAGTQADLTTTPSDQLGNNLYVEVKRISATLAECSLYSDKDYSILVERITLTVPAGIVNLRYIGLKNRTDPVNTGSMTGIVDDVQFWNQQSAVDHENKWTKVDE